MKEQEKSKLLAKCYISASRFGLTFPVNSGQKKCYCYETYLKRLITHYFHILFICTTFEPDNWLKSNHTQFIKSKDFIRKTDIITSAVKCRKKGLYLVVGFFGCFFGFLKEKPYLKC